MFSSLLPRRSTRSSSAPLPPSPRAQLDPRQVLSWSVEAFGERLVLATALGPQSLVLIDMLHRMGLSVRTLFLDTDLHFPQTYALKRAVERRYGLAIESIAPVLTLDEQAAQFGERLWERDADRCCQLRKVAPLREALRGAEAWITGLRRSQGGAREHTQALEWDELHGLIKVNPLYGWRRADVETYLREHEVPYNALRDEGYASVGCWPCTSRAEAGESERAGRWRGSGKSECGLHRAPARSAQGGAA